MSVASTVSAVIEVPWTHSCGVRADLSRHDGGDLVLRAREDLAARCADKGDCGVARDDRREDDESGDREGGRRPHDRECPHAVRPRTEAGSDERHRPTAGDGGGDERDGRRRADRRLQDERNDGGAKDGPEGVRAEEESGPRPDGPVRVRDEQRAEREDEAHDEDGWKYPQQKGGPLSESDEQAREQGCTHNEQDGRRQLGDPQRAERARRSSEADGEQLGPHRDPHKEGEEDDSEHVGRSAGPDRQDAGPRHLQPECREARHECDAEREGESRAPGGGIIGGRRRCVEVPVPSPGRARSLFGQARRAGGLRGQQQCGPTCDQRADRAHSEGPGEADQLDEDEAGRRGPDDRAQGVERVQPPERGAQLRSGASELSRQNRKGRPQEDGRGCERDKGEAIPDRKKGSGRLGERAVREPIRLPDAGEQDRRGEGDHGDRDLQEAVQAQGGPDAVGHPASDDTADRHPGKEPGEDRGDRLGRIAEDEHELARPDDLVDETGRARDDEDGEDDPTVRGRRRCR